MLESLKFEESLPITELTTTQVKELQEALKKLGYDVKVDGIMGANTIANFNQFKYDYKLTNPSEIGNTTVQVLEKALKEAIDNGESEGNPSSNQGQTSSGHKPPSNISEVNWNNFKSPVSVYFTVGEVTQWSTARIPTSDAIKKEILAVAKELDKVRKDWGSPIGVTSWYRPPSINAQVGGVSNSQHLTGGGVDIYPIGKNIYDFQKWLDANWYGALGYGAKRGFCHCDRRNYKGWKTGGSKGTRWNY
jgi:hypothetical protein